MPHKLTEQAAIAVTVSAPGWVPYLQSVNVVLTTISLVLGIGFAGWTWWRAAQREGEK